MDLSLDDIIKKDRITKKGTGTTKGRGGGRGGAVSRGQGQQKQRGSGKERADRGNRNAAPSRPATNYKRGNVDDRWSHDMYEGGGGGGGGGAAAGRGEVRRRSGQDTTKLMISNLDFGVTDADVKELFGEFGAMRSAAVHYDRSGRSMGTAQVVFERRSDAARAMKQYGGVPLDGRPMKLELATDQLSGGGGGGGGGGMGGRLGASPRQAARGGGARGGGGGGRGAARGGRGGGGGGRGGARQPREKKKPATAEELDAELDAYVNSAK